MKLVWTVVAFTIAIFGSLCFCEQSPIVVLPGQGTLKGSTTQSAWTNRTIYQFLNVKYAEAPIGQKRFKAPEKALSWDDVRDASVYGGECPDYRRIQNYTEEQLVNIEDCLSIAIYSTDLNASMPVLFYIHGGGFYSGAATSYLPDYLLEKDIVLVVPQYRLGPLGFLSTMSEKIPGNAAMLDIVLALEWVQNSIQNFGGDPAQVTIAGQSAGAASVATLLHSPLVPDNFFNKAIIQSGGSMAPWVWDHTPIESAKNIAELAGCNISDSLESIENCLIEVDALKLVKAFSNQKDRVTLIGLHKIGGNRLVIGGPSNYLPKSPYVLMKENVGRRNLSMMAGVTKHDGSFLLAIAYIVLKRTVNLDDPEFIKFDLIDTVNRILGFEDTTGTLSGYEMKSLFSVDTLMSGKFSEAIPGLVDLAGTIAIKAAALKDAQANFRNNPGRTFLYSFDYQGEFTRFGYGADTSSLPFKGGVHHSDDNMYLFPYRRHVAQLNKDDTEMAKKMVNLWTSFVIDDVPKDESSIAWPPVSKISGPYLHINKECTVGDNFYDEFSVAADEGKPLN